MKRRVIKQGPSSFMICLPKDWVRQKEVKKGQELNVEIVGETILISIESSDTNKEIPELKFGELDLEQMYTFYSEGFPGINIQFKSEKEFKKIKKIVDGLIGADILEIERNKVNILFSDVKINLEINKQIIKIISLIKWQIQSLREELKEKKLRPKEEILEIYLEILSKINFLLRSIFYRKRMGIDFVNYKISLEHLKNIQKGIISFYEKADIKSLNIQNYDSLESFEDVFVHLIELFSKEKDFNNNLNNLFIEITELKNSIVSVKLDKYLFALFDEIIIGLESFCLSLKNFHNAEKDSIFI